MKGREGGPFGFLFIGEGKKWDLYGYGSKIRLSCLYGGVIDINKRDNHVNS
jgi:hypothetical protein